MWLYRYYVTMLVIFGGACVWVAAVLYGQEIPPAYLAWPHLAIFFFLGLALNTMTRRLPGPGRRYAMAFFAPMLLLGPAMATLLAVAACALQSALARVQDTVFERRKQKNDTASPAAPGKGASAFFEERRRPGSLLTQLLPIAQTAIAIIFAGCLYLLWGGKVGQIHLADELLKALGAGACLLFVEVILAETATSLQRSRPLFATWRNGLLYSLPMEGSLAGLGLLLVLLYQQPQILLPVGPASRPLAIVFIAFIVFIPCWMLYYSYRLYLEMRNAYERTLRTLAGLVEARIWGPSKAFSEKQAGRSTPGVRGRQTAECAAAIAEQLGLPPSQVEQVRFAGYLLEVGKMGLPRSLLVKNGFISPRQRKAYARYAELGSQILEPVVFLRAVAQLIRHQQERYDGLGYPSGLRGDGIPLGSRILAATQAYVELTEGDETNSALSAEEAFSRLAAGRGIRFDPRVVDALAAVLLHRHIISQTAQSPVVSEGI